jgi:hypothetical protein
MKKITSRIDDTVKAILAEATANQFSLKNEQLSQEELLTKELKKTARNYFFFLVFAIVTFSIILLVTGLQLLGFISNFTANTPMTPLISIMALIYSACHFKIKREKIKTALYLIDLKKQLIRESEMEE